MVAAIPFDTLEGYLCYSTKMYGGGDKAQCQAFAEFMNTLKIEFPLAHVSCHLIYDPHDLMRFFLTFTELHQATCMTYFKLVVFPVSVIEAPRL